jgi:putative ABC transport system permease protein
MQTVTFTLLMARWRKGRDQLNFAFRMSWRETRAASGKFLFLVLAIALGTGALTAVTGFNESVRYTLRREARSLMAADVAIRLPNRPTDSDFETIRNLESEGIQTTRVTESVSMALAEGRVPVLVSIKGADFKHYPFYGELELDPANALLDENSVAVSAELLQRLNIKQADSIRIGKRQFRIAAQIIREPDRMTTGFTLGPRVFLTREGLQATGIISDVSRATERVLLKLPETRDMPVLRASLEASFGRRARISDYTETNPALTRALDRATRFLAMVSLIALIVGGLGVGATMQSHIRQKMTSIAFMKCVGGRSADILRIYFVQAIWLGLTGSILGAIFGAITQSAFARLLATYFDVRVITVWPWMAMTKGIACGLLTTVLFALPALLAVRSVRPSFLLRKEFSDDAGSRRDPVSLLASLGTIAGLWGIAVWISASLTYASIFAASLVAAILIIGGVGALLLRVLKSLSRQNAIRNSPALRHGIANLYRPGAHATAILASISIGVMFTLCVYSVQHSILDDIRSTAPPDAPNVFLINVTEADHENLDRLIESDPAITVRNLLTSSTSAQLVSIDGKRLEEMPVTERSRRFLDSPVTLTVSKDVPAADEPQVSVLQTTAETLHLKVGSILEWTPLLQSGKSIRARVSDIRRTGGSGVGNNGQFVLSPGGLDGVSTLYFGSIRVTPGEIAALQSRMFERFPTVTVVNGAEILQVVQDVVDRASLAVRFVAGFAIFGGLIVLASSVAGTRFRRMREVAILKTVGATRNRLVRIFSTEFATIGIVAGLVGSVLGSVLSVILISRLLETPYHFTWLPAIVATGITAALTVTAGWIASYGVLSKKPLEILRNVE